MRSNRAREALGLVLGVAFALALAGCGSGGKTNTTGSDRNYADFLNFSKCMRSHGVPNFSDPNPGGGIQINIGSGLNPQAPAFQAAHQSCKHLLPGGGPPAHVPESVKLRLLRQAQCMRAYGVPNYPDPTFPKGGGILVGPGPGSAINPNSPAFQSAAKACGGP
jgi:hypothetical protein